MGGTCWLKSGPGRPVANANAIYAVYTPTPPSVCGDRPDLDIVGNDLESVPSGDASSYCAVCQNTPSCVVYTWSDYQGGTCWLKSKVTEVIFKAGVTSGVTYLENSICLRSEKDTNYVGNDIGNRRSSAPDGCCEICLSMHSCNAYSWTDYEGGTCWLKSSWGKSVNQNGTVSAPVFRRD